jgi:hypothetical protein
MKNLILGKKLITIFCLLALLAVLYLLKTQYDQIIWQKNMKTAEHRLQLGSYIFTKSMQPTGNQTYEMRYLVYKVVHLHQDFVKLAVVRKLSTKDQLKDSDFSTTANQYETFKKTIIDMTITGILSTDLHQADGEAYVMNTYLLKKYPSLLQSKYYYEDIAETLKNKPAPTDVMQLIEYISLVYSREKIIKEGVLIPYTMDNYDKNQRPELYPNSQIAEDIQLIINKI